MIRFYFVSAKILHVLFIVLSMNYFRKIEE